MRDPFQLVPPAYSKMRKLIDECNKQGLKIGISECLRTKAEQDDLYASGRTKPGTIVTNAKGSSYSSFHQWGTAFDFYRNDGKGAYYNKDGFFKKVGKIGKSIGLEWGGDWKSPVDQPHFQLPQFGSTTKVIKECYKKPEFFISLFDVVITEKRITQASSKEDIMYLQHALNICVKDKKLMRLKVDGEYGTKTVKMLLKFWDEQGWNKKGLDNGTIAGQKTIRKLNNLMLN